MYLTKMNGTKENDFNLWITTNSEVCPLEKVIDVLMVELSKQPITK